MKKIMKPTTVSKNTQTFLTFSCTKADTITKMLKMATTENKTPYVLPGSGGAGLYFPARPIRVAKIIRKTCTKMTASLNKETPTFLSRQFHP